MWVVAADTPDKLPDLPTVRISPGSLCLEDRGITCLFTWYAPVTWSHDQRDQRLSPRLLSFLGRSKNCRGQLESTLFVSTVVPLHRVSKLIPPHVCHFQVLKRDT